jgi:hypothetical protein
VLLSAVLAGGPLRAWPAALGARSRPTGVLAGRPAVVGAVGGPLLGVGALDGHAGPLPVSSLAGVVGLGAEGPLGVGDLVGAPVLLDLGRRVAPGPPAPGRLGHRAEHFQHIARAVGFDRYAGGSPLPGQGPHDLPILGAEVGVGFQPGVAKLLVLAQLPLPIMGPVGLLGGHRHPTRYAGRSVIVAAQPAKHAGRLVIGGLLVGGQGLFGLLAVGGGPGQLAAAVAGGLVEPLAKPVALGPQPGRGQPLEVQAAGGVDGQGLAPSSGQGLGQLQVAIRLLPIGQVQRPGVRGRPRRTGESLGGPGIAAQRAS